MRSIHGFIAVCLSAAIFWSCNANPRASGVPSVNAGVYTSLYSFKGGKDGADPEAELTAMSGVLYGTTKYGGGLGHCFHWCGTVFEISTLGKERVLYRFRTGNDGATPVAGLIALNGEFFGTTTFGGGPCNRYFCGNGTIFEVSATGKERVVYRFGGPYKKDSPDGALPRGTLVAVNGKLYGSTSFGGNCQVVFCQAGGDGTIFEASVGGNERVLYSFGPRKSGKSADDGIGPNAGLIALNGLLYGTTGTGSHTAQLGTVFQVSTSGVERVLYRFKGRINAGPDGALPEAGLLAANGTLYGTTLYGGDGTCHTTYSKPTCGTVFQVTTSGVERVLHRFNGGSDGAYPEAALTYLNGVFYGTTRSGGTGRYGTVFELSSSGVERVLYSFRGGIDGEYPDAGLVSVNGALYGTTGYGGAYGKGTVFKLTP